MNVKLSQLYQIKLDIYSMYVFNNEYIDVLVK